MSSYKSGFPAFLRARAEAVENAISCIFLNLLGDFEFTQHLIFNTKTIFYLFLLHNSTKFINKKLIFNLLDEMLICDHLYDREKRSQRYSVKAYPFDCVVSNICGTSFE